MKLAEALRLRKEYKQNLSDLNNRININCLVQEGELPSENPDELNKKYMVILSKLEKLIVDINLTNSNSRFVFGSIKEPRTMTEAIAERDSLKMKLDRLKSTADRGSVRSETYSRKEVKIVSVISVEKYRKEIDNCSKDLRLLDTAIQSSNWTIDLIEH